MSPDEPTNQRVFPALAAVAHERRRQVAEKGYSTEQDNGYLRDELVIAGIALALSSIGSVTAAESFWPHGWRERDWFDRDRRAELVKAGAMIVAEIERIDRLAVGASG